MDRKSVIVLLISFVLLVLWYPLMNHLYPPKPRPAATNVVEQARERVAETQPSISPAPEKAATVPAPDVSASEKTLVVTNDAAYLTFTSHGGGLKRVDLRQYPATIECDRKREAEELAKLNANAPLAVLDLVGADAFGDNRGYELSLTDRGVRAQKSFPGGLRVVKEFDIGTNHLIVARTRIENTASEPVAVPARQWVVGTATPMGTNDVGHALGVFWYNGAKSQHITEGWFANRTLGCFPGTPRSEFRGGENNVGWAGVHNQFFTIAAIPSEPAPEVVAYRVPLVENQRGALTTNGYQAAFAYPATVLQPSATLENQFTIYAGPREYNTLARLGSQFKNELELIMDFDGFFGWFAQLLLVSMNGLHSLGLTYGLAIVCITIIIKLLFWPLTNASTKSMKRMAALQPQMKAIQEKYKEDPRKMNQKLMEFMKEHKVSPLGGCLPMLLQIPVFFGFYKMLQSAIELRGASFLWACDLSQPDTIFHLGGFPVNPMPLIMGVTMIWQARLMPVSPGMDPVQQKMMRYMPVMFVFFLYNFSSGLTLYWTVQNLLTIVQTKLTKTTDPAAPGKPPAQPQPPRKKK